MANAIASENRVDSIGEGDDPVLVCTGFFLAGSQPVYEMVGFPLRLVRN